MELPIVRDEIRQYAKLAVAKAGYVAGQVEVTSHCFQHCRACESWRDDLKGVVRGVWSLQAMEALCGQLDAMKTFEHLTLTGGDPQHWPHLAAFLNRLSWSFALQINTALTQDVVAGEWNACRDVYVSLDAIQPELYQQIRGDKHTHPAQVLGRMSMLCHPRLATRTTCMTANIEHMWELVHCLDLWNKHQPDAYKLRKAVFLAVIGPRDERGEWFWNAYQDLRSWVRTYGPSFETSFEESVVETREFCASDAAAVVPCHAGSLSFHAKANGDWYPCCLAGGEAITTYPELKIGNFFQECERRPEWAAVQRLLERYRPACHYANPKSPCRDICQWKQLQVNVAGHIAQQSVLAMP
jgi:MoaA/NifB/PqqE/SkfB family radical SAM enzyme